jgi:hypothetical protein
VTHDNRSTWRSDLPIPTVEEMKAAFGPLTYREIAAITGASVRAVESWMGGERRIDAARWELALLWIDQHPEYRLVKRRPARPKEAGT